MCGINWIVSTKNDVKKTIQHMNKLLHHRWPDDSGYFFDNINNKQLSLWQTRLAILDLSKAGHQPMWYDKKLWCCSKKHKTELYHRSPYILVFNGEIYNYKDIKKELLQYGYIFNSSSDTEVILAAYDFWWKTCVQHFNGMWAFTIYDINQKSLFCSRDRLGIKPFYYYHQDNIFCFSSELQSLLWAWIPREFNTQMLKTYLKFHYTAWENTLIQNIKKLPAAHNLIYDINSGTYKTEEYWKINNTPLKKTYTLEDEVYKLDVLVNNSVKIRTETSDVPVGTFLSWWLDSSLTTALFKKYYTWKHFHTFNVVREDILPNESAYANIVSKHVWSKHHTIKVTGKDVLASLEELQRHYSEPLSEGWFIPNFFVSKYASKRVKVVLTWDGADEVFGWYGYYNFLHKFRIRWKIPWVRTIAKIFAHILQKGAYQKWFSILSYASDKTFNKFFIETICDFSEQELQALLSPKLHNWYIYSIKEDILSQFSFLKKMLYTDIKILLQRCFNLKPDHALMAHHMEGRAPLEDYRLVEYVFARPDHLFINKWRNKYILSLVAKKYLPKKIFSRKKQWYGVPIHYRITHELKKTVCETLMWSILVQQWYFSQEEIKSYINNIENPAFAKKIRTLFSLEFYIKKLAINVSKV